MQKDGRVMRMLFLVSFTFSSSQTKLPLSQVKKGWARQRWVPTKTRRWRARLNVLNNTQIIYGDPNDAKLIAWAAPGYTVCSVGAGR